MIWGGGDGGSRVPVAFRLVCPIAVAIAITNAIGIGMSNKLFSFVLLFLLSQQ